MNSAGIAKKRAMILRPILEIEKKGLSVSQALEDAAWELNLRIRTKKRLKREKPEPLAVPDMPNHTWSMDFMADQLGVVTLNSPSRNSSIW